jgi:hypothetical protein
MRIVATRHVEWPRAYEEAAEKYASEVKLSVGGLRVED